MIDTNVIQIESLSQYYSPERFALKNVSLEVPRGALVAIIGRNGAGKTTLFKCIAGLINFYSGSITIGVDREKQVLTPDNNVIRSSIRLKIGMVFQDSALWPHMSVLDNVMKPLIDTRDISKRDAEEMAHDWLLKKLKLDEMDLRKYPYQLSGGLVRCVAIARTFAIDPDILLIDEIEANLDPEGVENVIHLLEEKFIKDDNKTIFMITHRIDILERCASKAVVLDEGSLIEYGTPQKILENPAPQTASFIQEVIDPARSQWIFGFQCLQSSINITSLTLKKDSENSIFQNLALEVGNLITKLELNAPHLVLIVTKKANQPWQHHIRGVAKSEEFVLDGQDVQYLRDIVKKDILIKEGTNEVIRYKLVDNYHSLIESHEGAIFDAAQGSLIAMMFTARRNRLQYRYTPSHSPIPGVYHYHTRISNPDASIANQYYEFSRETKNVYLFPMEWENEVIGVLSIDTYSTETWRPFVVRQFKLIANMGAIAIKIMKAV